MAGVLKEIYVVDSLNFTPIGLHKFSILPQTGTCGRMLSLTDHDGWIYISVCRYTILWWTLPERVHADFALITISIPILSADSWQSRMCASMKALRSNTISSKPGIKLQGHLGNTCQSILMSTGVSIFVAGSVRDRGCFTTFGELHKIVFTRSYISFGYGDGFAALFV